MATFYLCVTLAWLTLALQLDNRHRTLDANLRSEVYQLWGQTHYQPSPSVSAHGEILSLKDTKVQAQLRLSHRKKGMLWYATYTVDYKAQYDLEKGSDAFSLPLPVAGGLYSDFSILVDGRPVQAHRNLDCVDIDLPKGSRTVSISYRSQGSDRWTYDFNTGSPTANLSLEIDTDFGGYDFPDGGLSPTSNVVNDKGAKIAWSYQQLLSGGRASVKIPQRENPGPKLIDICLYAPFGLGLFLVMMMVTSLVSDYSLSPVHLVLCTAGYFAFHLQLVYFADQIGLEWAFILSALISILLVQTYLARLFGLRYVWKVGGWIQFLYLVVFSTAFLSEQMRGLPLVGIMLLTLAVLMHLSVGRTPEFFQLTVPESSTTDF